MPLWKLQGGGGYCYFDMYRGSLRKWCCNVQNSMYTGERGLLTTSGGSGVGGVAPFQNSYRSRIYILLSDSNLTNRILDSRIRL